VDIRTNDNNLMPFDEAARHYREGRCDGVGVVTGEIDGFPLCGIDLDNIIDEKGMPLPGWEETALRVAEGGYCEYSPSGRGLRGLAICYKPEGYREKVNVNGHDVEVRFDRQYMTITGDVPPGASAPLSADGGAVKWLCERYLKQQRTSVPTGEKPPENRIQTALEKDGKFASLWNGDRPSGDESAGDLALMNKLAYWLDRDEAAMIDAFLSSPYAAGKDEVHRKKLKRDYLRDTARKAIAGTTATASEASERFRAELPQGLRYAGEAAERKKEPEPFAVIDVPALMKTEFPPLFQPVERFIVEGLTFIVGASKIGKSWFTLLMCLQVAKGEDFLGMKTTKCPVMYLALEDSERRLQDRIRKLGIDIPPDHLFLATRAQVMDGGFEKQLDQWFSRHGGKSLVVIDTFQKARGIGRGSVNAYQSDYDVVSRLKAVADRHRGALVGIHHTNKLRNVADPFEKVSGSMGIMGAADTTILLEGERGADMATLRYTGRDVWGADKLLRFHDCRWELVSDDATAAQEQSAYEASPIVQLFRKLISENPQGGRWTYDQLYVEGLTLLGYPPFSSSRDCAKKLKAGLDRELLRRDGIVAACGVEAKRDGFRGKGVKLEKQAPRTTFQTEMGV